LAIGLGRMTTFGRVVFPQAIRIILAPTVNLFVGLLKGATIIGVLGVADMFYFAKIESLRTFKPFELYTAGGLILVAVTIAVAGFAALLDRRLGRGASRG
jgi:ABC-type amino acid transport system permease subunit